MARYLLYLFLLALTLSTPSRADSISCIVFLNYYVPAASYKVVHTKDDGACCRLCADDGNCEAWTRDSHGRCGLKSKANYLLGATGVTSGIKYRGKGNSSPQLKDNGVGASVLFVKADNPTSVAAPARSGGGSVSASVEVQSTGGSSVGRVTASNQGASSFSSVSESGSVKTSASTPTVSLATFHSVEEGRERAKVAVVYYKKPVVKGEVTTIKGNKIPIILPEDGVIFCYTCSESPCTFTKGISYKKNGVIVADYEANSRSDCCRACRSNPKCVSWWFSAKKRCVLNSNFPKKSSIDTHVGGLSL